MTRYVRAASYETRSGLRRPEKQKCWTCGEPAVTIGKCAECAARIPSTRETVKKYTDKIKTTLKSSKTMTTIAATK